MGIGRLWAFGCRLQNVRPTPARPSQIPVPAESTIAVEFVYEKKRVREAPEAAARYPHGADHEGDVLSVRTPISCAVPGMKPVQSKIRTIHIALGAVLVAAAACGAQDPDLIVDGGFEEGRWTCKQPENCRIVSQGARSGQRCARISLSDAGGVDFRKEKFFIVSQPFDVQPGQVYTLTFWWRYRAFPRPRGARFWVHAWCYDQAGKYVGDLAEGQVYERGWPPGAWPAAFRENSIIFSLDAWQRRVAYVSFPRDAVTACLCLELIGGAGEVCFDDVSLVPGRVKDRAFLRKPTARIRLSAARVYLGEWIEADAGASAASPDRRVCGFEWRIPVRERQPFSLAWPLKRLAGTRLAFRPLHPGRFYVSLRVFDSLDVPSEPVKASIEVLPNEPPRARVSWQVTPEGGINLDASKSSDPDGAAAVCRWEFPDGRVIGGTRARLRHAPMPDSLRFQTRDGEIAPPPTGFTVRLSVTDDHGLAAAQDVPVRLTPRLGDDPPTLPEPIRLEITRDGALRVVQAPRTCSLRLGFREYLPVRIANRSGGTVLFRAACVRAVPGVRVRGFEVRAGINSQCTIELQSLLFSNSTVLLWFVAGAEQSVEIPVALDVRETMPLFGTQEHFTRTPPERTKAIEDMSMLAALPCQVYRLPDMLTGIARPDRDWSAADWYFYQLQKIGHTRVLPFLGYIPPAVWNDLREGRTEEWDASVRRIVRRFADRVDYWMPYNEPPWDKKRSEWFARHGADAMLVMQEVLYRAVRELDPTAKVMSPGWALHPQGRIVVEKLFARGVDRFTDIFCMHSYTCKDPLSLDAGSAASWKRFDEKARAEVEWMLERMRQHGVRKPLWITECGGPSPDDRSKAMQWLRTVVQWLGAGVKGIIQYELFDYPHDAHPPTFALLHSADHYPTDYFTAYREIIRNLTGSRPERELRLGPDVRCIAFRRGGERIYCLWSNARAPTNLRLPIGGEATGELRYVRFAVRGVFARHATFRAPDGKIESMEITLHPLEFCIVSIPSADD